MRLRIMFVAVAIVVGLLVVVGYPFIAGGPAFAGPGGAAGRLLRGGAYPGLTIEIDTEVEIPQEDIDRVVSFVSRYSDKTVIVVSQTIIVGERLTYSIDDVLALRNEQRNTPPFFFMSMSIHVLVLDAAFDKGAAAIAYGATSIAIFLDGGALNLIAITVSHEIGHLFGLSCAAGLTPPPGSIWLCDGSRHSSDSDSLMAPVLQLSSRWVIALELMPDEVEQLEFTKANQ